MLQNSKILIARDEVKARSLKASLEGHGADVTCLSLMEITGVSNRDTARAMEEVTWYDFIVLTSANAVTHFLSMIAPAGGHPKVAAVGDATKEAAMACGWEVAHTGNSKGAKELAEGLHDGFNLRGQRILYPCSARARRDFKEAAMNLGAKEVNILTVYENACPKGVSVEDLTGHNMAVFYSPSQVSNFLKLLRLEGLPNTLGTVAVGPTTLEALICAGANVSTRAASPSVADMTDAAAECWRQMNMEDK